LSILQRITTVYSEEEDRICLTGEADNAAPVVVWLTQRLVLRRLPVLFNWLQAVDIVHSPEVMTLTFRSAQGQSATVSMEAKPLRQWLSTLRNAWEAGQWPMQVWPGWISEPGKGADVHAAMWH
jgi:hypothetical protein